MNYQVLIGDDYPLYRLALKDAVAAVCTNCEFFEADSIAGLFDNPRAASAKSICCCWT